MSYWSPAEPRQAHILVVDDNIDELRLLLEALRNTGYRITLAFDALEGYRRATALGMDLVLLDVRMGTINGFAACRLLKADPATADIPVIFVTSSATPQERLQGLRSGAVDYIPKPFDPDEVLARVEIHLALAERRGPQAVAAPPQAPAAPRAEADPCADRDRVLARAAERLVLSDLSTVLPLSELAAQVGTHEKRLSRVFREHTGRTVFEFVREARLHEARRLLAGSAMRIEEIAAAVGFSSAANFATAFREHCGSTPSAFRQAAAADPDASGRAAGG
ncbi:MAG: helix-turn-helix domain-containing protein [Xenophilus sp.]